MSGSARKPDKPQPSYVDGKVRDPQIAALQKQTADADPRGGLLRLIRRSVQRPRSAS